MVEINPNCAITLNRLSKATPFIGAGYILKRG